MQIPGFLKSGPLFWLLPVIIWTELVGASLWWSIHETTTHSVDRATHRGRDLFNLIQLTRAWSFQHGGVYAVRSPHAIPNPYLKHSYRDLSTKQGIELTMINPAYMTRQISELARSQGFYFHITSLKPLRPPNAPDVWERRVLQSFEKGIAERIELVEGESGTAFRYMAPLITEPACMACHAIQGYRLGDVRGGISVNIDATEILEVRDREILHTSVAHGIIWLAVSSVIYLITKNARRRLLRLGSTRREQAREIAQKNADLKHAQQQIQAMQRDDELTGLYRREYFSKALQEALDRAEARRESVGLLLLEMDCFAEFNAEYGALEGDIVLRMVAELLKKRVSEREAIHSRYIGSSFAVQIPRAEPKALMQLGESLCRAIYQMGIKHEQSSVDKFVTATIGLVHLKAGEVLTAEELLRKAAVAMKAGKRKGRNCAVIA